MHAWPVVSDCQPCNCPPASYADGASWFSLNTVSRNDFGTHIFHDATSSLPARCGTGVHSHLLPLRSRSFRGLTILEKSGTSRRYHDATIRYCRRSLTVDGGSSSAMAANFSGSVPIPSLVTRCPRYSSSFSKTWHFSGFSVCFL